LILSFYVFLLLSSIRYPASSILFVMKRLGVNIDHVATLREARHTEYPDVCEAARAAIAGGADQITAHLREDRRHMQDGDVERLRQIIRIPLNLEMAAVDEIANIACRILPHRVTLVPERREELTTEGGLRVAGNRSLPPVIKRCRDAGVEVVLFVDPDRAEIDAARELNVEGVELHTGTFCNAETDAGRVEELERIVIASQHAHAEGFMVAAGHGLHYENIRDMAQAAPLIEEYNIGHSIVARAVFVGLERAVQEMKALLEA
jgi:pyridoxine 5-phosphate synthase